MNNYTILTKRKVEDDDHDALFEEQDALLKEMGFNLYTYETHLIHYFDSAFYDECTIEETLSDAIEGLAIKEGADLVRFDNGNIGFVAYYGENKNGFEILNPYKIESFNTTEDFINRMMEVSNG